NRIGRSPADAEQIELRELLLDVIEVSAPPEGFRIDVPAALPAITSARSPLRQIFLNLVGNAVKHHDKDRGHIRITWEDAGPLIAFSVTDDGPGIAPEHHEDIFTLFQTIKRRDEVEGSGMGLSIVKKILYHHGGTIRVASEEGKGTTFTFTWPKTAAPIQRLGA
ncbi:MAG: hypothetical protein KDC54_17910, partial [Lewinella sp.]|nr:hypothetical protein [Lewinella sp.]